MRVKVMIVKFFNEKVLLLWTIALRWNLDFFPFRYFCNMVYI